MGIYHNMLAKTLSKRLKAIRTIHTIMPRDYPNVPLEMAKHPYDCDDIVCQYCHQPFDETDPAYEITWEHLDDNNENQEPWNLVWVHFRCNQIKKFNLELKVIAGDIIKKNKEWHSKFENDLSSECEKKIQAHKQTRTEELTDGQINLIFNKITKLELETQLPENSTGQISYDDIKSDIHYLVMQETNGRGSEPAARRALDGMTKSKYSPWRKRKLGKGNMIIERNPEFKSEKIHQYNQKTVKNPESQA